MIIHGFEEFQRMLEASDTGEFDFAAAVHRGELGAAEIFAEYVRGRLLYDIEAGLWYHYDEAEQIWREDPTLAVCCQTTGRMFDLSVQYAEDHKREIGDDDAMAQYNKWAWKCFTNHAGREGMLRSARGVAGIWCTEKDWDADPYLINTPEGVVDVRYPGMPPRYAAAADLLTCRTRAHYRPGVGCPLWEQTVSEIFSGDHELVSYFQRCVGYSALGFNNSEFEQKLFLAYGRLGGNGKNTLFDTIVDVLGTYAGIAGPNTFNQGGSDIPEAIHDLRKCRLVLASEPSTRTMLDEEMVKALTGNATMRTRTLYQKSRTWHPKFCIWMLANRYPGVANSSSLFRRFVVFPFERTFLHDDRKIGLQRHLLDTESSGILNWILAGSYAWTETNLDCAPAPAVLRAHREFITSVDTIQNFIAECMDLTTTPVEEPVGAVYGVYRGFCEDNGYRAKARNRLIDELQGHGILISRKASYQDAVVTNATVRIRSNKPNSTNPKSYRPGQPLDDCPL